MISVKSEVKLVEEKTFELLERMYAEFSEFRKESGQRFDNIDNRLDKVEGHVTRIEIEHGKKLDALFDGYNQTYERLQQHNKQLNDINTKIDKLSDKVSIHDSKLDRIEKAVTEHNKILFS